MARCWVRPRAIPTVVLWATLFGVTNALNPGGGFDRASCRNRTLEWLGRGNNATSEWFHRDPSTDRLLDQKDNVVLTLRGCQTFCGERTWYWDAGPRMNVWVIPILVLLSNIELSPIDKRRFMTIVHALGDPIDSLWSMIHKIYTWHRLYNIGLKKSSVALGRRDREHRARIIATVLAGFEEISGAWIKDEGHYHMLCRQLGKIGEPGEDEAKFREWHKTARELADGRTNEFLRTVLAIFVYVFSLISAFEPDLGGGNTTPPGGRIGSALFLSWLVPAALLSNTIGTYSSRRTCLDIMGHFMVAVNPRPVQNSNTGNHAGAVSPTAPGGSDRQARINGQSSGISTSAATINANQDAINTVAPTGLPTRSHRNFSRNVPLTPLARTEPASNGTRPIGTRRGTRGEIIPMNAFRLNLTGSSTFNDQTHSWETYFNSMQWLGSIYTFRPWKGVHLDYVHRTHPRLKNLGMLLGAFLPVLMSAVSAVVILWYAVPAGFSCRHIWVLVVLGCWMFSVTYTWILYLYLRGAKHWWAVLIKDFVIGVPSVLMVFLSTAGQFNSCSCWSTAMMVGSKAASVPLSTERAYEDRGNKIYQFVVMTCMLVHLIFFVAILVRWRKGLKLVRWSERKRRQEWNYSMGDRLRYSPENFLIFWFVGSQVGA